MKTVIFLTLFFSALATASGWVFSVDDKRGVCMTDIVPGEYFCLVAGTRQVTKPKPPQGCFDPWTEKNAQCVAVLKLGKVK